MKEEKKEIRPQEGFQLEFLSTSADIAIGGGAAGSGKTIALLLEPLRHALTVPGFESVIFRRTTPQIRNAGGLRDKSVQFYGGIGTPRESNLERVFETENKTLNKLKFSHLEYETNKLDWQGTEIAYLGFDELTHFTRSQFFYILSRNRSTCGVKPYVRATCNPDPDSRVKDFIARWIEPQSGYIIKERCGKLRYMTMDGENVVRGNSIKEVLQQCPYIFNNPALQQFDKEELVKSVTFIEGDIYQNKELLDKDPGYLANLLAQDPIIKKQLLEKNWNVHQDGSNLYQAVALDNMFTNFAEIGEKYITCDVARFGADLAVIKVWEGWRMIALRIFTKSSITDLYHCIELLRELHKIPISQVVVDQDGLGGGLVDMGGYVGFSASHPAMEYNGIKENYDNLKTQCYYRIAKRVNEHQISVSLEDCLVDGLQTKEVIIKNKPYDIQALLKKQLRIMKMKNIDKDGKRCMNNKEEQKNALGGMSPDLADAFMMREWFELGEKPSEPDIYFL